MIERRREKKEKLIIETAEKEKEQEEKFDEMDDLVFSGLHRMYEAMKENDEL